MVARKPIESLGDLFSRCDELGDCWIWRGYCSNGTPMVWSGKFIPVRRIVWRLQGNPQPTCGRPYYIARCGNARCISCVDVLSHKQFMARAARLLARSDEAANLARRMKLSAAQSRRTKLDDATVASIIASPLTSAELARENNVSETLIHRYKTGSSIRARRLMANPWAGLLT